MSEYSNVEAPFLQKLRETHWKVIDQGQGIPQDPAKSMRTNFGEVALPGVFLESVGKLNPWATREQLQYCYERVLVHSEKLFEVNKAVFQMLRKGITLPGKNQVTGEENPTVKLVDLEHWENNSFWAINQFLVETPTMAKKFIIPDIVCFVNGLPWVVVECKDLYVAEPLSDAYTQIRRYSNQRNEEDDPYAQPEGKEQLFYTNLFSVITYGTEAKFGTITADFDYYYNWADIFPEKYRTVETADGGFKQEVIIGGMFNHEILIDILRNFTIFMSAGEKEIKVVCRYQQYRAVGKMIEQLKRGADFRERSGVVWHTQGSGKSLTMVFLVRKMRTELDLKGYKILLVVDRLDLEEQLEGNAVLTGEKVNDIEKRSELYQLEADTPDLNLVMIHKFGVNQETSLERLYEKGIIPKFEEFKTLNQSEKVLILIDEAHRSQGGDMATNLFIAFPNATRIGFTGTPLLTERHKIKTAERFFKPPNDFIDTYKMNNAVRDHATVDVKYIGKATSDEIKDKDAFDQEYELAFRQRTEEERQEIMKRYGDMVAYLESYDRVRNIARDVLQHYVSEILPNGFKAMVVSASITAAARYKIELERLIPEFIAAEEAKPENERDETLLARLKILKVRAVISMKSNNEPAYITEVRKEGAGRAVTDAFRKNFNTTDPQKADTGIGILCVCDRLLTGFDAPIAQVMYLDRSLKEHDLLQAIARVNRTKKGKTHGLVVDYFGITKNLSRALGIYTDRDEEANREELREFSAYFNDINKEIPELELRYQKIIQFFQENNLPDVEDFLTQSISDSDTETKVVEDVIALMDSLKLRAEFNVFVRNYFDRLDLLFNVPEVQKSHWIRAKRLGYLIWRIRFHFRDDTMDLKWASEKVRRLIDKYLKNLGIVEKVSDTFMLSGDFPKISALYRNHKSQASAMEHAIRWQIKVDLEDKDPGLYQRFKDRLDGIINTYQGNWAQMIKELEQLKEEIAAGRPVDSRFKPVQAPFYEWIKRCVERDISADDGPKELSAEDDEKVVAETKSICGYIKDVIGIANFWEKRNEISALSDRIGSLLRLGKLRKLIPDQNKGELRDQIMSICKSNYAELVRSKDDLA